MKSHNLEDQSIKLELRPLSRTKIYTNLCLVNTTDELQDFHRKYQKSVQTLKGIFLLLQDVQGHLLKAEAVQSCLSTSRTLQGPEMLTELHRDAH